MRWFYALRRMPLTVRRFFRFRWQRLYRGWSDDELWNLDWTIAKFVLPRLVAFRFDAPGGYPCGVTEDEWDAILDKMIYAFDAIVREDDGFDLDEQSPINGMKFQQARIQEGLELFAKSFQGLWS